jgi:hypothetical protein
MATPPKTLLKILNDDYLATKDTNKLLPVVINGMIFILYVMCFVSLYKPNLELIGYGLFFTLHIIMSFGMMKNIISIISTKEPFELFGFLNQLGQPFSWLNKIPVYLSIPIGLLLLFVALLLLIIAFSKLKAKHRSTSSPVLPGFISSGTGEVISGYTYKYKENPSATNGAGHYLNSGDGTDLYFNDTVIKQNVNKFTIIAITTTVLLWAQYLLYANYELFNAIFSSMGDTNGLIIRMLTIIFGLAIIILSSICVSLTNSVNIRCRNRQDTSSAITASNNSGKSAETSVQPTTIYGQIQKMLKTAGL